MAAAAMLDPVGGWWVGGQRCDVEGTRATAGGGTGAKLPQALSHTILRLPRPTPPLVQLGLSVKDMFNFCMAPASASDLRLSAALLQFATKFRWVWVCGLGWGGEGGGGRAGGRAHTGPGQMPAQPQPLSPCVYERSSYAARGLSVTAHITLGLALDYPPAPCVVVVFVCSKGLPVTLDITVPSRVPASAEELRHMEAAHQVSLLWSCCGLAGRVVLWSRCADNCNPRSSRAGCVGVLTRLLPRVVTLPPRPSSSGARLSCSGSGCPTVLIPRPSQSARRCAGVCGRLGVRRTGTGRTLSVVGEVDMSSTSAELLCADFLYALVRAWIQAQADSIRHLRTRA